MSEDLSAEVQRTKQALQHCVDTARAENSAAGYFPLIYSWETEDLLRAAGSGRFEQPERVLATVVAFAHRYLQARSDYRTGKPAGRAWTVAFEAARAESLTVLQHVLLAFNAHINVDLAAASAETGLVGRDYDRVDEVLAAGVDPVQSRLNRTTPLLRWLDPLACRVDEFFAVFSLAAARRHAGALTRSLLEADEEGRRRLLEGADLLAEGLARRLRNPGLLPRSALAVARLTQRGASPRELIELLARGGPPAQSGP